ncbi:MAG: aminoacyl-histidine dipeptidase [Eubacteriales bacterium]|nr:aminoacyl-histidine dipeptidase [Eubacteriales bacterium]
MAVLENCEPKRVFYYFEEICKIPHGSGNTKQISDYLVSFAKAQGLRYIQDEMNNVIIYKPGTEGYEASPTVILQGHMDMVCEKRADVVHDFTRDGLQLAVEDGFVHASGTTLGGDDGIAVAYALALLESRDIAHPPLEVVITVDEEIGLLGAQGIDCGALSGKRFINLDSEEEGSLWISCAGGLRGNTKLPVSRTEGEGEKLSIRIYGLLGGHSGSEIDKIRANADKMMGRLLYGLAREKRYALISLEGGSKDNAIPRECTSSILAAPEDVPEIVKFVEEMGKAWKKEYARTDEGISVEIKQEGAFREQVLHPSSQAKVIFFLQNVPDGIQKMSGSIPGLVETSTNLGILRLEEKELYASCGVRSSIQSARDALSQKIEYLAEFLGGDYTVKGAYPAWEYREESPLRDLMIRVYREFYGQEPKVVAIHAGLECGLFYEEMEDLDCVSLGPNIRDIHTSEEKLDIASTERVWKYLLKVLEAAK